MPERNEINQTDHPPRPARLALLALNRTNQIDEIDQMNQPSLDARNGRSISPHPWRENKQAWREHTYRSMRAVKGSLGHSLLKRNERAWGDYPLPRSTAAR